LICEAVSANTFLENKKCGDYLTHEERFNLVLEISGKLSREMKGNLICFWLLVLPQEGPILTGPI